MSKAGVAAARSPDAVVLAADTVVAVGRRLLEKAADEAEAARFLKLLSGRNHRVFTGVAVTAAGTAENYITVQAYPGEKAVIDAKTVSEIKENRYDSAKDTLTLTVAQAQAVDRISQHWGKTFKEGEMRYGFLPGTVPSDQERLQISRFFFWTAWVASTPRTADAATYTNNWPPDRSIGNVPIPEVYFWSIGGLLVFLVSLGLFIFWVHHYGLWYGPAKGASLAAILIDMPLTPSQFKAAKFFLVVVLLLLLQTSFGGLLAHYTVNPASFWFPIVAQIIPYSLVKSWHLQLAIFWIATSWVASAIYLALIIGGFAEGTLAPGQQFFVRRTPPPADRGQPVKTPWIHVHTAGWIRITSIEGDHARASVTYASASGYAASTASPGTST